MHISNFLKIPHYKPINSVDRAPVGRYFTWTPKAIITGVFCGIPFSMPFASENEDFSAKYQNERAAAFPVFLGYVWFKADDDAIIELRSLGIER